MRGKIDLGRLHETRPLVLVVDDEPKIQFAVKNLLQEKYQVEVAGNGEDALALMEKSPREFNLIILDLSMPKMNGKEFTRILTERTTGNGKTRPPILVMTAHTDQESVATMAALKVQSYVVKPVSMDRLEQRVDEFLDPKLNRRSIERARKAEAWASQDAPREALRKIDELLDHDPLNRDLRMIAANVALSVGDLRQANYHSRVAHGADPESVEANLLVALTYQLMGEQRAAYVFVKSARTLLEEKLGG